MAHYQRVPHRKNGLITHVLCANSGQRLNIDEAIADLDGPPFRAYYCKSCAKRRDPEAYRRMKQEDN